MQVIDLDKIFETRLRAFMKENAGKYSETEWEDVIAQRYENFGKEFLAELGASPDEYYSKFSGGELAKLLKTHVEDTIPVPDFLCEAIIEKRCEDDILPFLKEKNAELKAYGVNLLHDMGSTKPLDGYFAMLKDLTLSGELTELIAEILVDNCEIVKEKALQNVNDTVLKPYMTEILARCKHDERIFDYLISEFLENLQDLPLYTAYLSIYGDARALSYLYREIEREDIDFAEFRELKSAIEALGGEYDKPRDFSADYIYRKMKDELND